jgi:hypothetical protein
MLSVYGWWNAGLELSLSPLQMAKAFGSPMFGVIHSGAGATGIVENAGDWRLRLGLVDNCGSEADENVGLYPNFRIGTDHSTRVSEPQKGLYAQY